VPSVHVSAIDLGITRLLTFFSTGPHPTLPEDPSDGDRTLLLAFQALDASDYIHSLSLVNESITQGISWDVGRAEALNLRGTFKYPF